jgi:hypothetical protein
LLLPLFLEIWVFSPFLKKVQKTTLTNPMLLAVNIVKVVLLTIHILFSAKVTN